MSLFSGNHNFNRRIPHIIFKKNIHNKNDIDSGLGKTLIDAHNNKYGDEDEDEAYYKEEYEKEEPIPNFNLELRKFNINDITSDNICVCIGQRNSGKTTLIKDVLYYHKNLPIGTVISGTEGANQFYSKIIPSLFIHEEYSPLFISNALKRQKLVVKKKMKDEHTYGKSNINPSAFLILDDCLNDDSIFKTNDIKNLFLKSRYNNLLFLISLNFIMEIPIFLRQYIDYIFIFRETNILKRKKIYEYYSGFFPTFEVFCLVMDHCTDEDYNCLVINNNAKSNKLEDQVYWYRANIHNDFKIGATEFWKHESNYYSSDSNSEDFDYATWLKEKKEVKKIEFKNNVF